MNPFDIGRTCALAVAGGRELAAHAAHFGDLFPAGAFDAGLHLSLGLAGAFGSPSATAAELRAVNRASLLVFAVDRLIDHEAGTREEVAALIGDCLSESPAGPAGAFAADLRAELGTTPELASAWRDRLARMLAAMAREWEWSRADEPPAVEEYLANADSCGASFVAVSHWIAAGQVGGPGDLEVLRPAGEAVQRYLRLLNDLATHHRERAYGDFNAFALGLTHDEVTERMAVLAREAHALIEPLRGAHPRPAGYLAWQIDYSTGFYGLSDFWATT
ncbi:MULTISPECIES: terpene synthase family protein [unclassified Nonomuraea]|uniref:terpene synthase family protein n=1 Tax=unclassified Nonomuraea TaxID=2593643 RepID=UPI0033DEAE2E